MSWQTTVARREAEHFDARWREHRQHCGACSLASDRRRLGEACPAGTRILEDRREANARLAAERAADKAPNPDQGEMF
jgi:hypothetical protein